MTLIVKMLTLLLSVPPSPSPRPLCVLHDLARAPAPPRPSFLSLSPLFSFFLSPAPLKPVFAQSVEVTAESIPPLVFHFHHFYCHCMYNEVTNSVTVTVFEILPDSPII